MTAVGWTLVAILALLLVLLAGTEWLRWRAEREPAVPDWWERVTTQPVLVHMRDDGGSYRGRLAELVPETDHGPGGILLEDAEHLPDDGGQPVQLGGRVMLPHERVALVQEPPAVKRRRRSTRKA